MLDLRPLLRAQTYVYRVQQTDACTQIMPKTTYVNRDVPPQELVASAYLKADRYQLCWRVSCGQANIRPHRPCCRGTQHVDGDACVPRDANNRAGQRV